MQPCKTGDQPYRDASPTVSVLCFPLWAVFSGLSNWYPNLLPVSVVDEGN